MGKLFLKALASVFDCPKPTTTEENITLHLRANILTCGKISGVTTYGINGDFTAKMHTLENLFHMENATAHKNKAFVFQDPLIFNAICETQTECTLICPTSGISAAFVHLLNTLAKTGCKIYYAGNFTFRDLETADDFCKNPAIIPWRYTRADYERILQAEARTLPAEKKHLSLHNEELASLLSLMRKSGKTGSSMPLLPLYMDDIKNLRAIKSH
jgi:hypothetical protein